MSEMVRKVWRLRKFLVLSTIKVYYLAFDVKKNIKKLDEKVDVLGRSVAKWAMALELGNTEDR